MTRTISDPSLDSRLPVPIPELVRHFCLHLEMGSSVFGANSICPLWLICRMRAAFRTSSGGTLPVTASKQTSRDHTRRSESGSLSTHSLRPCAVAEALKQATINTSHFSDFAILQRVLWTIAVL